ncbi:hypothetical protein WJX74_008361 [Apatococcus lobatus]|uniref:Uncharacterized protein n=1 Tax=Apatococcus lobatus TaxID=904363 RepID=A0AAW1QLX0_9CHLO
MVSQTQFGLGQPDDPCLERSFRGHRKAVTSVCFNSNMTQVISGSLDGCVMVWHFKPQMRAFRFAGHRDAVYSVAYDKINGLIASGSKDKTIRLWHPTVEGRSTTLKAHTAAVRCVSFSQDGRMLISASDDKSLKVWSLPAQRFLFSLTGHSNWVRTCHFSPDGRLVVSGSDDRTVRIWDVATRSCIRCYDDHSGIIEAVRFHPDGTCIASASSDNTISVWDIRSNQMLQHYTAHTAPVTSLAFHPSGNFLISSSLDSTLKVWDLREGQLFYTLYGHEGAISAVAFASAGDFFASAGADEQVMVWRTNFDRALEGYVLSAVQPAGAPAPGTAQPSLPAAPQTHISLHASSKAQQQQQASSQPQPAQPPAAESQEAHAEGSRQKPVAWVLAGTKPTQPPSKTSMAGAGRISKNVQPLGQNQATAVQRPSTAQFSVTPLHAALAVGLDEDIAAAMQQSIPAHRPSTAGPLLSSTASRSTPQHATGNPFAGSPAKLSPGLSPSNQRIAAVRHTPAPAAAAAPLNTGDMPEALAATLQHIVGQLDVLTQTMSLMEERLSLAEDHLAALPMPSAARLANLPASAAPGWPVETGL